MLPPDRSEVIVVGSGPGGAAVGRELARRGVRVMILERGDNDPVRGSLAQTLRRAFFPGRSLLVTGQGLGMVRALTTGGSSLIYCATAFEPPLAMLAAHGVDIRREVEEIRAELPIAPLPEHLMSPAAKVFMASAQALGYDCRKLDKYIDAKRCRPDCDRCSYGCPVGAKWNARNFVDEACRHGARLIPGARVEKVLVENGRAVGVAYRQRGVRRQARAAVVVAAAGGIGSPLILRRSGIAGVGRDFFFDPLWFVMGRVPGVKSGKGAQMCAGVHFPADGIVMTDFNLPRALKLFFDLEVLRLDQLLAYRDVVPIMIKVRDGLSGRVSARGLIWKSLTREDKAKLDKGRAHARRILRYAGATDVYNSWLLAAHPGGTVKIGDHVDARLQTRIANLYVCDCSVIPEAWGLPPSLTLLALGKRLARHLCGEARGRQASAGANPPTARPYAA